MANPPRTHTTSVTVGTFTNNKVTVPLDWKPETRVAVVDLTALPPGLTPNLNGDGTYTGTLRAARKAGYQMRLIDGAPWGPPGPCDNADEDSIVQARPAPQPTTERIPLHQAIGRRLPNDPPGAIITKAIYDQRPRATHVHREGPGFKGQMFIQGDRPLSDGMVEVLVDGDRPRGGDQ